MSACSVLYSLMGFRMPDVVCPLLEDPAVTLCAPTALTPRAHSYRTTCHSPPQVTPAPGLRIPSPPPPPPQAPLNHWRGLMVSVVLLLPRTLYGRNQSMWPFQTSFFYLIAKNNVPPFILMYWAHFFLRLRVHCMYMPQSVLSAHL